MVARSLARLNLGCFSRLSTFGNLCDQRDPLPSELELSVVPKLNEYLTVREAAAYVGVSPNTLRNWGRGGKLVERRHPVNGYRLYSKEELDALLREAEIPVNSKRRRRKPK
jgi:hypothetical protein